MTAPKLINCWAWQEQSGNRDRLHKPVSVFTLCKKPCRLVIYYAFFRKSVNSVKLPKSLKSIGREAFRDCGNLVSVSFPKSVERIGDSAFEGCEALSEITQPTKKTEIGYHAFFNCSLPADQDGFVIVGSVLCGYTGSDEHVTVPDGIKRIAEDTFAGTRRLTAITLPEGLEEISRDAFTNCENLTSVALPDTVIRIGNAAFSHCKNLSDITLPESIKTIEEETK